MVTKDLASKIYNFAKNNPSGFTLNVMTLQPVTTGYIVSYKETQSSFSEIDLQSVITHALTHDGIVGGWYDTESKKYYFDSNKVFSINQLDKAIEFGIKNEQIAIFNLDTLQEIRLNEQLQIA